MYQSLNNDFLILNIIAVLEWKLAICIKESEGVCEKGL